MKNNSNTLIIPILFLLLPLISEGAVIKGKITDKTTGNPLFGVNVFLSGTTRGDMTNPMGYYEIQKVQTGKYRIVVSILGYETRIIKRDIEENEIVELNIALKQTVLEMEGAEVTASKPMIEIEKPASHININMVETEKGPVSTIIDIISSQAGVVKLKEKLHVRGGRPGEVVYMLDGCMLRDPYDHTLDVLIPEYSIRELTFYKGGYGAEYGEAQSGVIELTTRSALNNITLKGMAMSNSIENASSQLHEFMDPAPNKENFNRLNFRLGGPLPERITPGKRIALFSAGEYRKKDGRIAGEYDTTYSIYGKLTYLIADDLSLRFSGIYSGERSHHFGPRRIYVEEYCPYGNDETRVINTTLEKFFGEKTLIQLQFENHTRTITENVFEDGYADANGDNFVNPTDHDSMVVDVLENDTIYYPSDIDGIDDFADYDNDFLVSINGEEMDTLWEELEDMPTEVYYNDSGYFINTYYPVKWSYRNSSFKSYRINFQTKSIDRHTLKTGVEHKLYSLNTNSVYMIGAETNYGGSEVNPCKIGAFIQDKMDFKTLKVTAGLRGDYFNPNVENSVTAEKISPRLGLTFPITERNVVHATYGHYFQVPALQYYYSNTLFNPYLGNPELGFEQTSTYEVGVVHYIYNNLYIDLTGYYKNINGLIGLGASAGASQYYIANDDYGEAKGVEVIIRKEPGGKIGWLSGVLNITLSSARGKYSFKLKDPGSIWGGYHETIIPEFPLDWDERLRINSHIILTLPENKNFLGLWGLNDLSLGIITEYGSGLPYTRATGHSTVLRINNARLPARFTMDLRLKKNIKLDGTNIELFTDVKNVFNNENLIDIEDIMLYILEGDPDGTFDNPYVRERGRLIRFGAGISF